MSIVRSVSSTGSALDQILRAAGAKTDSTFTSYHPLVILSYMLGPVLIISAHLGSLLTFQVGLSAGAFLWLVLLYLIRMLATTSIYHRLLTHRSYTAPRILLRLGCLVAASAAQMGPSWWKAHHLMHHKHADQELDPHSPIAFQPRLKGLVFSQGLWQIPSNFPNQLPPDVEQDWVLKAIDRFHFLPPIALGMFSYLVGGGQFLAAFFLSTALLYHGVATVNSLSHIWGDQPFTTSDNSRNNAFVSLLTLGEGWHNLHHAIPSSSRHGYTIREGRVQKLPDPTFSFIRFMEFLGIATRLRIPTANDLLHCARPSA